MKVKGQKMNGKELLQSILTYLCTGGFVLAVSFIAKLSKRITVLEEHDKEQVKAVNKIGDLSERLTRIDTKLDLLLEGKIKGGNNE